MVTFHCLNAAGKKICSVKVNSAGFSGTYFSLYAFTEEELIESIKECQEKIVELRDKSTQADRYDYEAECGSDDEYAASMRSCLESPGSRESMFDYVSVLSTFCVLLGEFRNEDVKSVVSRSVYKDRKWSKEAEARKNQS